MNQTISRITTSALVVLGLGLSGVLLSGCTALDSLKKQMPAQFTTDDTQVPESQESVPNMDYIQGQEEPQPIDAYSGDDVEPADTVDQAIKNLETLPTESPIDE